MTQLHPLYRVIGTHTQSLQSDMYNFSMIGEGRTVVVVAVVRV